MNPAFFTVAKFLRYSYRPDKLTILPENAQPRLHGVDERPELAAYHDILSLFRGNLIPTTAARGHRPVYLRHHPTLPKDGFDLFRVVADACHEAFPGKACGYPDKTSFRLQQSR